MIVRELFARLGLDVDAQSFETAENRIAKLQLGLRSMQKLAFGNVGFLADLAKQFSPGIVGGLAILARQVGQVGAHANDTADRLGLSTDAVQELGYAAKLTDTSFESLQQGLAFMARKGVKDLDKGLADLADEVAALPPGGERAAAAMDALGRGGVDLVPLLAQGSEGIARLREQARSMGLVLEGDALQAADKFDDGLDRLGQRLRGLRNRVIGPWMPRLLKWLENAEAGFVKLSDAMAEATKWADAVGIAFVSLATSQVVLLISQLAKLAGGFVALADLSAAAALRSAATWAVAAAPIAAIAAAIGAAYLILEDLYVGFAGGESVIFNAVKAWVPILKGAFAGLFDWFVEKVQWVGGAIADVLMYPVKLIASLGESVGKLLGKAASGLTGAIVPSIQNFGKGLGEFLNPRPAQHPDAVPPTPPGSATAMLAPESFYGAGASPGASAAASSPMQSRSTSQFNASFVVNASPGQDPQAVAGAVRDAMDQWHSTKMRETFAAVGGG